MTDKQPEALEKIAKALLVVAQLCDGTKRWTMSVPARPDSDPDLVLSDALREADTLLRTQHTEIERLNARLKWEPVAWLPPESDRWTWSDAVEGYRTEKAEAVPEVRSLLDRHERAWHRMGELWERCQGKSWPEAESNEFTRLRDELAPAIRKQLVAQAAPQQAELDDHLKLHAVEELCQLGYTVKDGELFPPDHLHKLMEAAQHPLASTQQAEAVPPGYALVPVEPTQAEHRIRITDDQIATAAGWTSAELSESNIAWCRTFLARIAAQQPQAEPDMRKVCEALGFDPTNHHNAAKCPYCRGQQPQAEAKTTPQPLDDLQKDATDLLFALCDAWPYVHARCTIKSKRDAIQRLIVKHGDFADFWKDKPPQAAHRMADRLMGWKLPADFNPDGGIWFDRDGKNHSGQQHEWPTGTNLLTHDQAKAMFEYVLEGVL